MTLREPHNHYAKLEPSEDQVTVEAGDAERKNSRHIIPAAVSCDFRPHQESFEGGLGI